MDIVQFDVFTAMVTGFTKLKLTSYSPLSASQWELPSQSAEPYSRSLRGFAQVTCLAMTYGEESGQGETQHASSDARSPLSSGTMCRPILIDQATNDLLVRNEQQINRTCVSGCFAPLREMPCPWLLAKAGPRFLPSAGMDLGLHMHQ